MCLPADKSTLRRHIRSLKAATPPDEREAASWVLCWHIAEHPRFGSAQTILLYYPLPDEADVRPLLQRFPDKQFLLPVVVGDDLELRVYEGEESLRRGAFGILEPTGDILTDYESIQLAIIPGVAFTPDGRRLGRGRGYYDRLLPRLTQAYKLGVCWPFQLLDDIPTEPHDIRMDGVIWA